MGTTRKSWQTPVLVELTVRQVLLGSGAQADDHFGPPGWNNEGATITGPMSAPLFGPLPMTGNGPSPGPAVFGPAVFGPTVFGPPVLGPTGMTASAFDPMGPALGPNSTPIFGPSGFTNEMYGPPPAPLYGPPTAPLFGPPAPSDLRLKEDVRQVGTTADGLPLYTFRYRGQEGVYEGVMAQDVLAVRPDAVLTGADGYYLVDYDRLGVTFRRIQ